MPKIPYQPKRFSAASLAVIEKANEILEDYATQGYDLTLRQLYYQFVARGIIANQDSEYNRLGSIVNDARLAGLIDWDHITDRTRKVRQNSHWDAPQDIIQACAEQFQFDKWEDQANYVEVWVEKDALVGVLEVACQPLDVAYFSCRGYTSQSEMWVAAQRLLRHAHNGKSLYVVHLGDHDPSGLDMSRDITDRLEGFLRYHMGGEAFTLNRIALNMNQVRRYNPPPNPAKVTDSRARGYIAQHGNESWELDALEPAVMTALIRNTVEDLRDPDLWEAATEREKKARMRIAKVARKWDTLKV